MSRLMKADDCARIEREFAVTLEIDDRSYTTTVRAACDAPHAGTVSRTSQEGSVSAEAVSRRRVSAGEARSADAAGGSVSHDRMHDDGWSLIDELINFREMTEDADHVRWCCEEDRYAKMLASTRVAAERPEVILRKCAHCGRLTDRLETEWSHGAPKSTTPVCPSDECKRDYQKSRESK